MAQHGARAFEGSDADVTLRLVRGYTASVGSDASLVREILDGNTAAFAQLVDRHAHACLRFATRMLGNREDAEDVCQETFMRAFRSLERYDSRGPFHTWLMSILVNRCRSSLVLRQRREARVVADNDAVSRAEARVDGDGGALREAIVAAVARLEESQREAFLLKHVEGLSYEEMATMTGAGVSALKMRVQRACDRLQQLLGEDRHD